MPLTDDLPSQSIGALAFDVADGTSNTIYAGTGRYSSFGRIGNDRVGIYKSTDGGQSWTVLNDKLLGANISGIAANGNNVVVSVNISDNFTSFDTTGIFRSTNGGVSFTQVSLGNGSITGLPGGLSYDLVSDPTDPDILYTSTVFSENLNGQNGIYKSINGGATWAKVSNAAIDALIISGRTSNLELAVGRNNNVYAGIINFGNMEGLFRSGDGGATWTQMDSPQTNENGTDVGLNPRGVKGPGPGDNPTPEELAGGQGTIHFSIVADPDDANIVYVGGDRQPRSNGDTGGFPNSIGATDFSGRLFRGDASLAAGSQFVHLTHSNALGAAGGGTASSSSPHADSREMVFDADGNLIEVDDGGVYRRTSPKDNTGDWFSVIGNLQVTEAHDVAYDNLSNTLITGNQDTGTTLQPAEGAEIWDSLTTGDGGDVVVDNVSLAGSNRSVRYSSFQNLGFFIQSVWDAAGNFVSFSVPTLTGFNDDGVFRTPVELNAIDPNRLVIQGGTQTYETLDQGQNVTGLTTAPNSSIGQNALAYGGRKDAVNNPDVLWVGSGSNVFVRTTSGGTLAATPSDPTSDLVVDLAIDPDDWASAYVVDSNSVFATDDTGASWSDITGNLMSMVSSLYSVAYIATAGMDALLVGTNLGVFATVAGSFGTWMQFGDGLPNVLAYDLDYDATDDVLVAGTLGRGAWTLPNASTLLGAETFGEDFGDAPSAAQTGFAGTYPVTVSETGASHVAVGPTLGVNRDTELDGVHSFDADADDVSGSPDDEDGITILGELIPSTATAYVGSVDVNLQNADATSNRLDAWIDFNRDGDWDDAGEQIFDNFDLGLSNGVQSLSFSIPQDSGANVVQGKTYARFRLSTAGDLDPTGAAANGEVEDIVVVIGDTLTGADPNRWTNQGPIGANHRFLENLSPGNSIGGATHTVVAHPTDPDVLYIGTVNGGIWKTSNATDALPIWEPQTDFLDSLSIGAMAFDPTDASGQTLVAATARYSSFGGVGGDRGAIYLTTDGGVTWSDPGSIGLTAENLSGIAIRGNTIVATSSAFGGGIFRSTDGGATFSTIADADFSDNDNFSDLVEDPTDPNRLYAANTGQTGAGGPGGIYRSDDTGATWSKITGPGIDVVMDDLLLAADNIEMAVSPTTGRLYVAILLNSQPEAIFHASDAATATPTWTRMDIPVLPQGSGVAIASASNTSPIVINSPGHGLSNPDRGVNFVVIDGVTGNTAANGFHRINVLDADNFELTGVTGNGVYSGGGTWTKVAGPNPVSKDVPEAGAGPHALFHRRRSHGREHHLPRRRSARSTEPDWRREHFGRDLPW